jgi:hypothetical protein
MQMIFLMALHKSSSTRRISLLPIASYFQSRTSQFSEWSHGLRFLIHCNSSPKSADISSKVLTAILIAGLRLQDASYQLLSA